MARLRGLFEELGVTNVETFIASGNVIFQSRSKADVLQRKIEARLRASLGYDVATFIRTDADVAAIAGYTPFAASEIDAAAAFNVGFLAAPLGTEARKSLMALRTEIDDLHVHGREVYWLCRRRQSESTFSYAVLEKTLKVRATFRGMNTIARLAAKYPQ